MSDCDGQECGGGRKQGGGPDMLSPEGVSPSPQTADQNSVPSS